MNAGRRVTKFRRPPANEQPKANQWPSNLTRVRRNQSFDATPVSAPNAFEGRGCPRCHHDGSVDILCPRKRSGLILALRRSFGCALLSSGLRAIGWLWVVHLLVDAGTL